MKKLLLALILCPGLAWAQGAVQQTGPVTKGAPTIWADDHHIRQGAGETGDVAGKMITGGFSAVGGICSYSSTTDKDGYKALCINGKDGTFTYDGVSYPITGVATIVGTSVAVPNNVTLQGLQGATNQMAIRLGFYAPGDGGLAMYQWSSSPCTAADNGSQTQPLAGITGCWIADFSGSMPVPEVWGARGDGTTDDAAAINAAMIFRGLKGGSIHLRAGVTYATGATVTVPAFTCLIGQGFDKSVIKPLNGGFSPVIGLKAGSCIKDLKIDATGQPFNTLLQVGASGADYRSLVDAVYTQGGCIGADVNGSSHIIENSYFYEMSGTTGCGGIRLGHNTQGGATVGVKITNTITACAASTTARPDFNMLLEDAGGVYIGSGVDQVNCRTGTIIRPGYQQTVAFLFCNASVLGDTNQNAGLLIDTSDPTALVSGNSFNQCWTSGINPGSTGLPGSGIIIQNTGGGDIEGTVFYGHRIYSTWTHGVDIKKPVAGQIKDTTFHGIRVCNVQYGIDFNLGQDVDAKLYNSRLGKRCDGQTSGTTAGLLYGVGLGGNNEVTLIGNDLTYSGSEDWTLISGIPVRNSVIADNAGSNTSSGPTYASGNVVTLLLVAPWIHLTGTTTVNTITPAWNGQPLCITSNNGVINFGTSGNIFTPVATAGANGMVCGHYDGAAGKWYLH